MVPDPLIGSAVARWSGESFDEVRREFSKISPVSRSAFCFIPPLPGMLHEERARLNRRSRRNYVVCSGLIIIKFEKPRVYGAFHRCEFAPCDLLDALSARRRYCRIKKNKIKPVVCGSCGPQ